MTLKRTQFGNKAGTGAQGYRVCKQCGRRVTRDALSHNTARGWLLTSTPKIIANHKAAAAVGALSDPVGPPLGPALKSGRPVWLRASMLTPLAFVFIVTGAIFSYASTENVTNLSAGQCFSFQGARDSISSVNLDPCDRPHDAQVIGRIPVLASMAAEQEACHTQAIAAITVQPPEGLRSNVIHMKDTDSSSTTSDICLVENEAGEQLTKSLIGK